MADRKAGKAPASSLFARSLRRSTPRWSQKTLRAKVLSLGTAGLCPAVGLCAVLLVARANSRPDAVPSVTQTQSGERGAIRKAPPAGESMSQAVREARHPLTFYTPAIRGGLFSEPQSPAPRLPKVEPAPPKPVVTTPTPVAPVEPLNPFADWSYTGTITMGDQRMALLENTKTKEGQYLTAGQTFLGAQVESITDQMITLRSAEKPYMLAKSDTITVTPLDRSAPFLSSGANSVREVAIGRVFLTNMVITATESH